MSDKKSIRDYPLEMKLHLNCENGGEMQHRNDQLGLTRIVWTPKKKGKWGLGKATWFIDGNETELASLADVVEAMRVAEPSDYDDERAHFVRLWDTQKDIAP